MAQSLALTGALVFGLVPPTLAQDASGRVHFETMGAGNTSCGQYLEARRPSDWDRSYLHWVGGFLSAINWTFAGRGYKSALGRFDGDGALAWLDKYCRENPLDVFATAATALVNHLVKRADPSAAPTTPQR